MAASTPKTPRVRTGISVPRDVIDYLDGLAKQAERDRSWVIATLAREHREAKKKGAVKSPIAVSMAALKT
jgi:metal-responsive CopG/Arc/MetJ family transcriptional regulator